MAYSVLQLVQPRRPGREAGPFSAVPPLLQLQLGAVEVYIIPSKKKFWQNSDFMDVMESEIPAEFHKNSIPM